jgi:hypothetical protein
LIQTWQRITLAGLAALAALLVSARVRYPGKPTLILAAENCDAGLWKHVYRPERLRVIEMCVAVEGRVVSVRRESDGDLHVALDPDQKSVLNLLNVIHGRGHLVVESICDRVPAHADARSACAGFTPQVAIPNAGARVRVIGAYVTDRDNGWNEVHPVTRIETLR